MANNAEDIENNMVSMKECIPVALALYLCSSASMYWVMITKQFSLCATHCFRVKSVMKDTSVS